MSNLKSEEQDIRKSTLELPESFKILWEIGKDLVSERELIGLFNNYKEAIITNYSYMQILGMERSVPLDSIYTEIRLLSEVESRRYKSIDELEQEIRKRVEQRSLEAIKDRVRREIEDKVRIKTLNKILSEIEENFNRKSDLSDTKLNNPTVISNAQVLSEEDHNNQLTSDNIYNGDVSRDTEKRAKIKQAKRSVLNNELTNEQLREIEDLLSIELERELERVIQRELNKVVSGIANETTDNPNLPAPKAISGKTRVVILGKPGSGKTTFLKHIILRNINNIDETPKFPIFVTLKEFIDSDKDDLMEFIADDFSTYGFINPMTFIIRLIERAVGCLILLDGLDEVPRSQHQKIARQINKLAKRGRNNQIIVSCRTANYQGQLEGFTQVEIADFGPSQITKFVKNWFHDKPRIAVDFLKELKLHPGIGELTTTPLLLALLCIAYKRILRFPDQKPLLYLTCIDALFVDWDSSRQIRRETFVEKFDIESKNIF